MTLRKAQFELFCGFAGTYLANIYSGDWFDPEQRELISRNVNDQAPKTQP